ncbi:alpha/beta fold hydrolase [Novosphingobium endophyticum]|uniref:alpha/beta fold hydrolase n=1 Tax=Novosphingobium endophyticum TaxID=1955250 RepID=UPI0016639F4C|nr:alpha/beta hydrolase [Novosphingobium endophyticum]
MRYVDWGGDHLPPLVLIHGGGDHSRSWDWVARRLCARWHVIAVDLRGHGDSDWSPEGNYGEGVLVRDLLLLLDALAIRRATIIAHSLGANIAMRFAAVFPERMNRLVSIEGLLASPDRLVLVDNTPMRTRLRTWLEETERIRMRVPRHFRSMDEATARMKERNPHLAGERLHHLTHHAVRLGDDGFYRWKVDPMIRKRPPDMSNDALNDLWRALTCPILLLYGAESWASNPGMDGRLGLFANARLRVIEEAGHWVHHDRFEETMREIDAFLSETATVPDQG